MLNDNLIIVTVVVAFVNRVTVVEIIEGEIQKWRLINPNMISDRICVRGDSNVLF